MCFPACRRRRRLISISDSHQLLYLHSPLQRSSSSCKMFRRYVPAHCSLFCDSNGLQWINWADQTTCSALQKSAVRASRSAFRPAVTTGLRAASARFASDSAIHGKIHQVIGAVVDGEWAENSSRRREQASDRAQLDRGASMGDERQCWY